MLPRSLAIVILSMALPPMAASAQTQLGTEFTYQGHLTFQGAPLNDTADIAFTLWSAKTDGTQHGTAVVADNVTVVDGFFSVPVDFGAAAFNGQALWLQIHVRSPAGDGVFVPLPPRQPVTATPYANQTRGLFVSDQNMLGIGTTSPDRPLSVRGVFSGGFQQWISLRNASGDTTAWSIADRGGLNITQPGLAVSRLCIKQGTGEVGIGTASPTAELDVIGQVAADQLKLRAGAAAGRVLTSDADGAASWQPTPSNRTPDNMAEFWAPGLHTWTAPAGVTTVVVQAWGAGGSGAGRGPTFGASHGAGGGGGGSGGYGRRAVTVTPGVTYHVFAGNGGGAVAAGEDGVTGGASYFRVPDEEPLLIALGGQGGHAPDSVSTITGCPVGGLGGAGGTVGPGAAVSRNGRDGAVGTNVLPLGGLCAGGGMGGGGAPAADSGVLPFIQDRQGFAKANGQFADLSLGDFEADVGRGGRGGNGSGDSGSSTSGTSGYVVLFW
jgi:hypothetical protein